MQLQDFERFILSEIKKVVESIITNKIELPISAKSRAGAEISDYLEDNFVKEVIANNYFVDTNLRQKVLQKILTMPKHILTTKDTKKKHG